MAKIVVIEDDLELREGLTDLLRTVGHEVREFENGCVALRALRSDGCVDVILLDLMMPVMNGWEFRAAQLRDGKLASIPVIIISGAGQLEQERRTLCAAGALKKPFDLDQLSEAVETVGREA